MIAATETPPSTAPPAPGAKSKPPEFLHRLESLRGVAAFMVAGMHSFGVLAAQGWYAHVHTAAITVFNGHAAVTIFFVLSGFVLGASLARGKGPFGIDYLNFGLRRIFRIYPGHVVACLAIASAVFFIDQRVVYPPAVSAWFASHWSEPLTFDFLLKNLLFINTRLNVPTWTLRAELVCSFALPLLFLLSRNAGRVRKGFLLLGLMTYSLIGQGNLSAWMFMFYLGLLIPEAGRWLMTALNKRAAVARFIAPIAWILVSTAMWTLPARDRWWHLIEGVSAALFVSALLYGPELKAFRLFDTALVRFYGRISYSFYLYHMVSLYLVSRLIFRVVPPERLAENYIMSSFGLLFVSTAIATAAASASYYLVEKPLINFSKSLCAQITRKFSPPIAGTQSKTTAS